MKLNQFQRAFIALEAMMALIIVTTTVIWFTTNYSYMLQTAKKQDIEVIKLRIQKEQSDEKLWQAQGAQKNQAVTTLVDKNQAQSAPGIQPK